MTDEAPATNDPKALLEQYKLYVDSADGVSERRSKANAYYVSVTVGLLAVVARFGGLVPEDRSQAAGLVLMGVVGILVCVIWSASVSSFRQLNTAKFKVIHELEKRLPYPCYDREWELLGSGADRTKYLQITWVEKILPIVLAIPNLLLVGVGILHWV